MFGPCDPCGQGDDATWETTNEIVVFVKDDDNLEFQHSFIVSLNTTVPENIRLGYQESQEIVDDGAYKTTSVAIHVIKTIFFN